MLRIEVALTPEGWDEETGRFIKPETVTLELEHSLAAISKWESKWHKPFFSKEEKTTEETNNYIQCMVQTPNIDPSVLEHLNNENIIAINNYIEDPMTATKFYEEKNSKSNKKVITAERVYCWMFSCGIPLEFENRHINHLLTLIRVFNAENGSDKKMSKSEAIARNKAINAKNRALLQSKGR